MMNTVHWLTPLSLLAALPSISLHAQEEDARSERETVSCKYLNIVGSRIPAKVCKTKAQWDEDRRLKEEAQLRSRTATSSCSESASGPC